MRPAAALALVASWYPQHRKESLRQGTCQARLPACLALPSLLGSHPEPLQPLCPLKTVEYGMFCLNVIGGNKIKQTVETRKYIRNYNSGNYKRYRCQMPKWRIKLGWGAGAVWRGWGAVLIYIAVQALAGHRGRTQDTLVQGKACAVAWRQR